MNRPNFTSTILAASLALLLASGGAYARGHGGNGHHDNGHKHGYKHHGHHRRHANHVRHGGAHAVVRGDKFDGRHDNGLHLGQHKAWTRGERLPSSYLQQRYYIDDYRSYQLAPPPSGYVWVRPYQDDRRYYLVQIATGLISQLFGQ